MNEKRKNCYTLLSMLYLAFMMASLLLSYRFINIAGLLSVGSVFVIPFTYAISDIVAELYGYAAIRRMIWSTLFCLFILSLVLHFIVQFPVNQKFQNYTQHYHFIFDPLLKIYFSNFAGIVAGIFLNAYVLIKWKIKLSGRFFYWRSIVSSAFGEIIFTSITVTLVQLGISNVSDIAEMVMVSVSIKFIFTLVSSLMATLIKQRIIKIDGGNCFESENNYSPFSL